MKRPLISLCMIVKNEEKYLKQCLDSMADLFDEVIITDTGSTDNTIEIAKSYPNVKVFNFKWIDNFSAARNYSFKQAKSKYIMWVDADDVLLEEDRQKFIKLKEKLKDEYIRAVSMVYKYAFNENNKCILEFKRNRIFLNNKKDRWEGYVHEVVGISIDDSLITDINITHTRSHSNGSRNLDIFENKRKEGETFNTRNTLYYAKELYYNNLYERAIEVFNEFFKKPDGWKEDIIDARIKIANCYKALGNEDQFVYNLNKTLEFDLRAEAMYPLANYYYSKDKIDTAIMLYEGILRTKYPENCNGFLNKELWEFLPAIQLSVIYYTKDYDKAKYYHEIAKALSPDSEIIINNDQFFNK